MHRLLVQGATDTPRQSTQEMHTVGGELYLTWMKAVATITPEPKYLATKKAHPGTRTPLFLWANIGKQAPTGTISNCPVSCSLQVLPNNDPISMTKIAETLRPILPS